MFAAMSLVKSTTASLVYLFILFTTFVLIGCNGCQNDTQKRIKPTTKVDIHLKRFEKDLFTIKPAQVQEGITHLYNQYGPFYLSYARDILNMPLTGDDSLYLIPMKMLLEYQPMIALYKSVDSMYANMSAVESDLSGAMSIYQQEFPHATIPAFITFISEFGYANITYDGAICIGLDMYMNQRFADYYRAYEFPEFMIRKLRPEYIAPNAVKALAIQQYENQSTSDKRFLATMIVEGKARYFVKALLPDVHDSIVMGYTQTQLEWSQQNNPQIWTHIIEKKLLYQNEPSQFMRYFNDGPFTSADGVPPESAPMIGTWTGLQIVRKYMEENPSVSLRELMEEKDFDKILKLSKYRP
jgi:hypothetical protein